MSEQKQPLWQAMDDGMDVQANKETGQTDPLVWRRIRAAEIRAVRDWLAPEEESPLLGSKPDVGITIDHAMWKQREYFRTLLTAEADRAERGDQPTIQEHLEAEE